MYCLETGSRLGCLQRINIWACALQNFQKCMSDQHRFWSLDPFILSDQSMHLLHMTSLEPRLSTGLQSKTLNIYSRFTNWYRSLLVKQSFGRCCHWLAYFDNYWSISNIDNLPVYGYFGYFVLYLALPAPYWQVDRTVPSFFLLMKADHWNIQK